jgi:hypothetical protein
MHMKRLFVAVVLAAAAPCLTGCGGNETSQAPVATPGFKADRGRAALGSPVDLTYTFDVAQDAKIDGDYRVFVHFLDSEGDLMWTDDHTPVPPTTDWKPGQKISYSHTMFVPVYPYTGEATVRMGLYSPPDGRRLPLGGTEVGTREYRVGTLTLAPQSENIFLIFKEGWNQAESAPDQPALEWQWTKKRATLAFRNPRRDVIFYLEADGRPDVFSPPQQVTIIAGEQAVHTFGMTDKDPRIHRIPITAAQLGSEEMVDLHIEVDRTFVPEQIPAGQPGHGADSRELGVRVYHVYVAPK